MTDRIKGCFVAFDRDVRDDDVEPLLNAIRMIRGVSAVKQNVANPDDWFARQRVKATFQNKLFDLLKELGDAELE